MEVRMTTVATTVALGKDITSFVGWDHPPFVLQIRVSPMRQEDQLRIFSRRTGRPPGTRPQSCKVFAIYSHETEANADDGFR